MLQRENIKAVIFDLDDTLMDRKTAFENYCRAFIKKFVQNRELPDSVDAMVEHMVLLDNNSYKKLLNFYSSLIEKWDLKDVTAQQLIDDYVETFGSFAVSYSDTQPVLDYLRPKYKLGIITNGSSKTQNIKIDRMGIRKFFDSIIVSGAVGIQKPDRQIFMLSCNALNVEANEAVYIGDY